MTVFFGELLAHSNNSSLLDDFLGMSRVIVHGVEVKIDKF
jgi:hypothetical protein